MLMFIEELWGSIVQPGANKALVTATHTSFAALEVILALMFFATYSLHFAAMFVLAALLWWSIHWFIIETSSLRYESEIDPDEASKKAAAKAAAHKRDGAAPALVASPPATPAPAVSAPIVDTTAATAATATTASATAKPALRARRKV